MRHLILTALMLGVATAAAAQQQEQTLITGNVDVAAFGGPDVRYARIADQDGVMLGARGGIIVNRSIVLSGAAYGMVTEIDTPIPNDPLALYAATDLRFGYGGFLFEYIVKPEAVAHVSVSALIGGGATRLVFDRPGVGFRDDDTIGEPDGFFVLEPGVNLELNVTKWLHVGGGVSYRAINGVERPNLSNSDLSGISATIGVKFIRR